MVMSEATLVSEKKIRRKRVLEMENPAAVDQINITEKHVHRKHSQAPDERDEGRGHNGRLKKNQTPIAWKVITSTFRLQNFMSVPFSTSTCISFLSCSGR